MFNGAKPEAHFIARETLGECNSFSAFLADSRTSVPPPEIVSAIFPWVDDEWTALRARREVKNEAKDFSLEHFLELLIYLCKVLVQDLAILLHRAPACRLFAYAPFDSPAFRTFAESVPMQLARAEEDSRLAFQNLPEHMAQTMRGVVENVSLAQQQQMGMIESRFAALEEVMAGIGGSLGMIAENGPPRKRTRKNRKFHYHIV